MFGRSKPSPTQSQQLLDELAQSYGHFKLAAGHVAGGAAETVTPTYDKARNAATRGWTTTRTAFSPIYEQMKEGAANARKENEVSKNRWPMLVGLLAAGAAVGAAGAMVARRRRVAAQWEEYEPMPGIDDLGMETETARSDQMSSATKKVAAAGASVADSVSTQAGKIADTLHEKSGASDPTSTAAAKAGDLAEKGASKASDAATTTKNKASGSGKGSLSSFAEDTADDAAAEAKHLRP